MDRVGRLFRLTWDNADDTLTPYNREATEDAGGEDDGVMLMAADTAGKEWTLTRGAGATATQAPNQALPANPRAPQQPRLPHPSNNSPRPPQQWISLASAAPSSG
jgi:hypothetical protein